MIVKQERHGDGDSHCSEACVRLKLSFTRTNSGIFCWFSRCLISSCSYWKRNMAEEIFHWILKLFLVIQIWNIGVTCFFNGKCIYRDMYYQEKRHLNKNFVTKLDHWANITQPCKSLLQLHSINNQVTSDRCFCFCDADKIRRIPLLTTSNTIRRRCAAFYHGTQVALNLATSSTTFDWSSRASDYISL